MPTCAETHIEKSLAGLPKRPARPPPGVLFTDPYHREWFQFLEEEFLPRRCSTNDSALRGVTLVQLRKIIMFTRAHCRELYDRLPRSESPTSGAQLDMTFLNFYHLNDWIVLPSTNADGCSFSELLASQEQPPIWFISHWWGQPVQEFLACLEWHAKLRGIGDRDLLWISAFATRQRPVDDASASTNPLDLCRAMERCKGSLLVIDGNAQAFERAWLLFEASQSLACRARGGFLLDFAVVYRGKAQVLADGLVMEDSLSPDRKAQREDAFPIDVLARSLRAEFKSAATSCEMDRRRILNSVAGRALLEEDPLKEDDSYTRADATFRGHIALAMWPQAARRNLLRELRLPLRMMLDSDRQDLTLSLAFLPDPAPQVRPLFTSIRRLPLQRLELDLQNTNLADVSDFVAFFGQMPALPLLSLKLNFFSCMKLTHVKGLGLAISSLEQLDSLSLDFGGCRALADASGVGEGIGELAACLRHLQLGMRRCDVSFGDILVIAVGAQRLHMLQDFQCDFTACPRLPERMQTKFVSVSHFSVAADISKQELAATTVTLPSSTWTDLLGVPSSQWQVWECLDAVNGRCRSMIGLELR